MCLQPCYLSLAYPLQNHIVHVVLQSMNRFSDHQILLMKGKWNDILILVVFITIHFQSCSESQRLMKVTCGPKGPWVP